ncbi:uncharacterized protein LOC118219825 isoform X2 [Anguilla anguilla]|uniref:uncharacterized protein LOC118219825 isoform X2 n=1 Tax=Anguilla anguilla TaxID=7936 RepID=UPI0015B0E3DC|nr:uncharacterized protein LOC118219825 isoform X2 [Anguilla anguilla]
MWIALQRTGGRLRGGGGGPFGSAISSRAATKGTGGPLLPPRRTGPPGTRLSSPGAQTSSPPAGGNPWPGPSDSGASVDVSGPTICLSSPAGTGRRPKEPAAKQLQPSYAAAILAAANWQILQSSYPCSLSLASPGLVLWSLLHGWQAVVPDSTFCCLWTCRNIYSDMYGGRICCKSALIENG